MIRVYSIHPMTTDVDSLLNYLRLPRNLDLVWDDKAPEILFVSEWIYYKKEAFEQFRELYDIAKIKILLAFEAISPDWNLFDYAIGFDNHLHYGDRFIRIMSPFDMYHRFVTKCKNEIDSVEKARMELSRKTSFCNFLYSNPNAHPVRDKLFYTLSQYKHVDSLGRHLNNVEIPGTGFEGHAAECVPMKRSYKFSIACENAVYPGYTSEKILTSLEAHTIPIYFGNPDICEDINKAAFINANDFETIESLVDYIREVDANDDLWCKYIATPWLTPEQEYLHKERTEVYQNKLRELLSGDVQGKERVAIGTHQTHYRQHFFEGTYHCDYVVPKKSGKYYIKLILRTLHLMK